MTAWLQLQKLCNYFIEIIGIEVDDLSYAVAVDFILRKPVLHTHRAVLYFAKLRTIPTKNWLWKRLGSNLNQWHREIPVDY